MRPLSKSLFLEFSAARCEVVVGDVVSLRRRVCKLRSIVTEGKWHVNYKGDEAIQYDPTVRTKVLLVDANDLTSLGQVLKDKHGLDVYGKKRKGKSRGSSCVGDPTSEAGLL